MVLKALVLESLGWLYRLNTLCVISFPAGRGHQQNGIFRFDHSTLRQTTLQPLQLRRRHLEWLRAQATTTPATPALAVIARNFGCGGEC